MEDHFIYCCKENPEVYLNKDIRNGISSFSDLSNKDEVEIGLTRIKIDIKNGGIQNIQSNNKNNSGDYLFMWAKK